jgi:hypothetical protein
VIPRFFSLKAGSHRIEGTGATPGGSSSTSIGELWSDIDKLDGAMQEGASVRSSQRSLAPGPSFRRSNRGMKDGVIPATRRASLADAPGPSSALPRGYGRGSVRSKAVQILSDAPVLFRLTCG